MAANAASERSSQAREGLLLARPNVIDTPQGMPPGRHSLELGRGRDGVLHMPRGVDQARPAPLIIALHGAGGVAAQVIDFLADTAEATGTLILAPDSRGRTWDVILGAYGPDIAFIDAALERIFVRQAVDPERVAVSGFSDGASYALSVGLTNGDLFGDVLAFSPGFMVPARQVGRPRVFISHGTHDEVLPIDRCSRRIAPALRRAGYDVDYREFDGGHVVPPDMVRASVDRFLKRPSR